MKTNMMKYMEINDKNKNYINDNDEHKNNDK